MVTTLQSLFTDPGNKAKHVAILPYVPKWRFMITKNSRLLNCRLSYLYMQVGQCQAEGQIGSAKWWSGQPIRIQRERTSYWSLLWSRSKDGQWKLNEKKGGPGHLKEDGPCDVKIQDPPIVNREPWMVWLRLFPFQNHALLLVFHKDLLDE